jgi:cytochrome c-type biogenesis protein CcmF
VRAPWTLLTLAFGGYAAWVTLGQMLLPMLQRMKRGDSAAASFVDANLRRGRRRFASYLVHGAVVIVFICIAVSSSMRESVELHFTKGQTLQGLGYDITFLGVEQREEPHRLSTIGRFDIKRNGVLVAHLEPRMNQYQMMREPIGTPDVHTTAARDVYVALSNIDPVGQAASITLFVTPLVVWIWIAVIAMGIGALFGLIPARRRVAATVADEQAPPVETARETA